MEILDPGMEGERRRETRYPVKFEARVQVPLIDLGNVAIRGDAVIEDLSRKGACVYIPGFETAHFPALTELRHSFSVIYQLPDVKGRSYLCGEVVWVDFRAYESPPSVRLGLEFKAMMNAERSRLERFVDQLATGI